jgi:large subunit ribosomal protein L36
MKIKSSIKKMCEGCRVVRYNQKNYIKCLENPRHKQRQKFSTYKMIETSSICCQPEIKFTPIKDIMSLII